MNFWIVQLIFNGLATAALLLLFVQKRKIFSLEKEVAFLKAQWLFSFDPDIVRKEPSVNEVKLLPEPAEIISSSLAEKEMPSPSGIPSLQLDRYEMAQSLFSKGVDLREISKQTGLSISEIQLLGKMVQKNH